MANGAGAQATIFAKIEYGGRTKKKIDREMIEFIEELTRRFFKKHGIDVLNKETMPDDCKCHFCVSVALFC